MEEEVQLYALFDLDIKWSSVVSLMLQRFYPTVTLLIV
jgi:hypothetical protein